MPLTQLIYVSKRENALTMSELERIVSISRNNNQQKDVSGHLMCCGVNLMQLLEGEESVIAELFNKIREDKRHSHVHCLLQKNVNKRLFPEWGMGMADLKSKAVLNRDRMQRMLDDIRGNTATGPFSVEARVLLADFQAQLKKAA